MSIPNYLSYRAIVLQYPQLYRQYQFRGTGISSQNGRYLYSKLSSTGSRSSHSGYVYNSEGGGVSGIPVKLYYKARTSSTYTLFGTYNTDATGKYTINTTQDTLGYDFQLQVNGLTIGSPTSTDAKAFNSKIFTQNFSSKDYYRMDINSDGRLNISDVYLTYLKHVGRSWNASVTLYYLFTSTEWSTINTSTSNLKSTYSGSQSFTKNNVLSKGTTDLYLVRTGFSN